MLAKPQRPSHGRVNLSLNVYDSISAEEASIDADTHIEVHINGDECEVITGV